MAVSRSIPVLELRGTHRSVGRQIGENMRAQIREMLARQREDIPAERTWREMLDRSVLFLAHSREVYPQYIDELTGVAEGADASFEEIFLSMCEELWEAAAWQRGCTDFAARGAATSNGHTYLAHTNDLLPDAEEQLVILKIKIDDAEPEFIGISSGGVGISAGMNAAGVGLTGNQLDNNDIRPGVPRLLLVRAILAARSLGEAMEVCLLPRRASSYNNVIADANGEVYSMEGSATDCEPIYINENILAHANHYTSPAMRNFEADRNAIATSVIRHNRAWRLLRENYGRLNPGVFQSLLCDHANYPASICKHGYETVTVFSNIFDLEERRAWIGRGRPCQTTYQEIVLTPEYPPYPQDSFDG